MTQQLDLAFYTSNKTDKMMSNTTMSYSAKENKSEIGSQFGNFLESANKNYKNDTNKSTVSNKEQMSCKNNDKKEIALKNGERKNLNSNEKTEDKTQTTINDKMSDLKQSVSVEKEDVQENTAQVQLKDFEPSAQNEKVESTNEIVDILSENVIANISDVVSNSAIIAAPDNELRMENLSLISMNIAEDELPVDALKSGISFENIIPSDVLEDAVETDIQNIDSLIKDVSVSKDEYISSMYKVGNDVQEHVDVLDSLNKDAVVEVPKTDVKVNEEALEQTEKPVSEIKLEVVDNIKDEKSITIDSKDKISENMEAVNVEPKNIENKPILDKNVELAEDIPTNEKVKITVEENNNKAEKVSVKTDAIEIKNSDVQDNLKAEEAEKVVLVQEIKEVQKTENKETVDDNEAVIQEEVKVSAIEQMVVAGEKTVKTDIKNEERTDVFVDAKQLKTEVKQNQNQYQNVEISTNTEQKTDFAKKVSDEYAKTNVDAQETMDIKDDVKGIEFVNNKFEEKTELKQGEDKSSIEPQQAKTVKQRVENVKMAIEEDTKVNLQLAKTMTDSEKVAKANETLEQAGLSTENLNKMDAKIKEIDNSGKNMQSDLGQSSKEMLMREIMQNNASSGSSEAVELKVDFNQDLNNLKLSQANNPQIASRPTEEIPEVNVLEQIRAKMALNSQNGLQKITIGLTPESLGKLQIEISKGQNGISAQIVADNPQAKEILDKNIDGLKSVLQSQGVNVNNVNVKVAEAGRSSDSNNNMFNQDDNQFNSDHNGKNSRNSEENEKEKRANYEFLQNEMMQNETAEEPAELQERVIQTEKTVNISAGLGKVSYKL